MSMNQPENKPKEPNLKLSKEEKGQEDEGFPDFHKVNKYRLDREWMIQPRMYRYYADKAAEAKSRLSHAKTEKEVTEADIQDKIRKNPKKYGIERVTDKAIGCTVILQPEYQKAAKRVIRAQYELNILDVALSTLDHRKTCLENLVKLFLSGYFAKPKVPKGADAEIEEFDRRRGSSSKEEDD